jgi:hypothetical protein
MRGGIGGGGQELLRDGDGHIGQQDDLASSFLKVKDTRSYNLRRTCRMGAVALTIGVTLGAKVHILVAIEAWSLHLDHMEFSEWPPTAPQLLNEGL